MGSFDYNLFDLYIEKKVSREDLKIQLINLYNNDNSIVLNELTDAYKTNDSKKIEYLLYSLFLMLDSIKDLSVHEYCDVLDELLLADWHCKHEDIVRLLIECGDSKSIDYIYKAIYLKFDYLLWDDNYSFEKFCIHALVKIDNEKSLEYLQKLCLHDNKIISECAKKQMDKLCPKHNDREVRAVFDNDTVRVYQAFNEIIADEVVRLGKFGSCFSMERMTWIKPSFLWMMYRSGWASKENQEHILAIDIQRSAFDYLVKKAVYTSYEQQIYGSESYWNYKLRNSDVLCQWDPERDIQGNPLDYKSLQLGIRGKALYKYVNEWIVSIEDITQTVLNLSEMKERNIDIISLLPNEKIYSI